MSEEKQRFRSASRSTLPTASAALPDKEMLQQVTALLKEGMKVKIKLSELDERRKEITEELGAIAAAYDLSGFRHGLIGFEYHGYTTRKTLSKERLLAAGVSAEILEECFADSEPFMNAKLVAFDVE